MNTNLLEQFEEDYFRMVSVEDVSSLYELEEVMYQSRARIDPFRKFSVYFDTADEDEYFYSLVVDSRAFEGVPYGLN